MPVSVYRPQGEADASRETTTERPALDLELLIDRISLQLSSLSLGNVQLLSYTHRGVNVAV